LHQGPPLKQNSHPARTGWLAWRDATYFFAGAAALPK
jgi:hypothetical protein